MKRRTVVGLGAGELVLPGGRVVKYGAHPSAGKDAPCRLTKTQALELLELYGLGDDAGRHAVDVATLGALERLGLVERLPGRSRNVKLTAAGIERAEVSQ